MAIEKTGRIKIAGEVKVKGFADTKSKFDAIYAVASKVAGAFDSVIDRSGKLSGMMAAQTLNIDKAQEAVGGLITKYDLIAASNRAVALGIKLTDQKFADLAKSAAVVARKMGTDVNDAIGDLMLGLGRGSRLILDNLGIILSSEQAYVTYAASIQKAVTELTESEKRLAIQAEALRKLNGIAGDGKIDTDNLAGSWKQLKVKITDGTDAIVKSIAKTKALGDAFKYLGKWMDRVAKAYDDIDKAAAENLTMQGFRPLSKMDKNLQYTGLSIKNFGGYDPEQYLTPGNPFAGGTSYSGRIGSQGSAGTGLGSLDTRFRKIQTKAIEAAAKKARAAGRRASSGENPLDDSSIVGSPDIYKQRWIEEGTGPEGKEAASNKAFAKRQNELANQADAEFEAFRRKNEAIDKANAKLGEYNDTVMQIDTNMANFANTTLGAMTSGIWAAADAALAGGDSFGMAMAKMVKSTLMGVAQQSTIKAIFEAAEALAAYARYDVPSGALHTAAAIKYGVVAGVAGTAGLALSAGLSGGGGGSARASRSAGGGMAPNRAFGTRRKDEKKTIVVNLHMGGRYDPAATIWAREQIEAST